jgi:hypothetical protein
MSGWAVNFICLEFACVNICRRIGHSQFSLDIVIRESSYLPPAKVVRGNAFLRPLGTCMGGIFRAWNRRGSAFRSWLGGALLLLCFAGGVARAQNAGSVYGTVVDSSAAVIPGATVTLTEPTHGFSRTVTSNSKGAYLIPDVPIGTYTLTVESPKFKTSIDQGIIVEAAQSVKLDITMSVGAADTNVTVTTEGSTIDARSATLGTMIDNKLVEELPINGENVVALAALLPGGRDQCECSDHGDQ